MNVTIYDIAEKAEVSIATVSKVINNSGRISSKTRTRVQKVMEELGYRPSMIATALSGKRTFSVGILIPDISNPFYPDIIRGAEDSARQNNYSILLCNTDNDPEKELEYIELLKQKSVDGIIAAVVATDPNRFINALGREMPACLIARKLNLKQPAANLASVVVDNFLGGYLAGKYLLECGHTKISLIGESLVIDSARERMAGCEKALAEAGLTLLSKEFGSGFSSGSQAMKKLLSVPAPPSAVFALTDALAIGALQAAKEANLKVPEDISIMGFDGTHLCSFVEPPLTSVAQPMYEYGQKAMEVLIRQIKGEPVPERIILDISLVKRGSVKDIRT